MSAHTKIEVREALKRAQSAGVKLPQLSREVGLDVGKLRNFAGPRKSWVDAEKLGVLAHWLVVHGFLAQPAQAGDDGLGSVDMPEEERLARRSFILELEYLAGRYRLPNVPFKETNSRLKAFVEKVHHSFNKPQ